MARLQFNRAQDGATTPKISITGVGVNVDRWEEMQRWRNLASVVYPWIFARPRGWYPHEPGNPFRSDA